MAHSGRLRSSGLDRLQSFLFWISSVLTGHVANRNSRSGGLFCIAEPAREVYEVGR